MNELTPVARHLFGSTEVDLWQDEHGDIFMTSEQIGRALEYADPLRSISHLFHRNAHRLSANSVVLKLTTTDGKAYDTRVFNEKGIYEIIRRSNQPKADGFYDWVYEVLKTIRKTGSYSVQKPQSIEDLIILQAQSMKELRSKVDDISVQLLVAQHRLDNLDRIDINGDEQQRLVAMVKRYAHQEGVTWDKAWKDFTDRFNTAYNTNLKLRIENYKDKHGLQSLTRPQYLSLVGQLQDAIRVADKMLNPVTAGV